MARPGLFLPRPGRQACRIDFQFMDLAGNLLESKTWELRRELQAKPQVPLLQANAKRMGKVPELKDLGQNHVNLTRAVASLQGG